MANYRTLLVWVDTNTPLQHLHYFTTCRLIKNEENAEYDIRGIYRNHEALRELNISTNQCFLRKSRDCWGLVPNLTLVFRADETDTSVAGDSNCFKLATCNTPQHQWEIKHVSHFLFFVFCSVRKLLKDFSRKLSRKKTESNFKWTNWWSHFNPALFHSSWVIFNACAPFFFSFAWLFTFAGAGSVSAVKCERTSCVVWVGLA